MQRNLIPPWAKDVKIGSKLTNATAETVDEKTNFKQAFIRRHCLDFKRWIL
ncbi:SOS response-associated peptidase family protein [Halalkalibacter akibai]